MVTPIMETEYLYNVVAESELDELLKGFESGLGIRWTDWAARTLVQEGMTGVLRKRTTSVRDSVRPLALVVRDEDLRRLFGRYSQLRSDLSPITAWCHVLTPQFFNPLESLTRVPDLAGLEAAWAGLVVAETLLLAERPVSTIRIPACLATQTFAIARTQGLWHFLSLQETARRYESANRICRADIGGQSAFRTTKLRVALQPICSCLIALAGPVLPNISNELIPIVDGIRELQNVRFRKANNEAWYLASPLEHISREVSEFRQLNEMAPEQRLRLFDKLVSTLNSVNPENVSQRVGLSMLAGYLATVAAGGAPSLSLAERNSSRWPEILAWAYVLGGIGERVVWTSSFDGLGRLVAREFARPFRIDEPPSCDFSFEEATILADSKLPDPLVHLRIKQSKTVSVALFPGVNIAVPVGDSVTQEINKPEPKVRVAEPANPNKELVSALADAVWPYLRVRVEDFCQTLREDEARQRNKKKSKTQQLPLDTPKK